MASITSINACYFSRKGREKAKSAQEEVGSQFTTVHDVYLDGDQRSQLVIEKSRNNLFSKL